MELRGSQAIITGAGSGIGRAIALAFARRGADLSLVDRTEGKLDRVVEECRGVGVKTLGIVADVTDEGEIRRIVEETESGLGGIDILVNNAGITIFKSIEDHTAGDVLKTLMVNVYAPIRLTQTVLPRMIRRGRGRIVNIGSIFGSLSFPFFGIYSASKWAVRGFSEALRRELHGTGVGVTYVAPRATRTSQSKEFLEMARRTGMRMDLPERVASVVVEAVSREMNEVYVGGPERLFVFVNKLFPAIVDRALKKKASVMAEYIPRA